MEEEGTLSNSLSEASSAWTLKPEEDATREETYRATSLMDTDADLSTKWQQTRFSSTLTRHALRPGGIHARDAKVVQHLPTNVIHHTNGIKDRPRDHLSRCRKSVRQNPASTSDKYMLRGRILKPIYLHGRHPTHTHVNEDSSQKIVAITVLYT